jgi:hypothetical protein
MSKSRLVSPPFTIVEWGEGRDCLADSPLGERLVNYLCLYTHALLKQGLERLNRLMKKAGLPVDSPAPLTLPQLQTVVSRLAARKSRWGVDYLEQLLAVNACVDHVTEEGVIRLDRRTQEKTRLCKELALRVLIACVNDHFGFYSSR